MRPHFSSDSPKDPWLTPKVRNVAPWKKIYLMLTPRRNLSAETDSPWSTEGPTSINYKSLARASADRGLSHNLYTRNNPRLSSWLPELCPPRLSWVNYYKRVPGFVFGTTDWDLPHPIKTTRWYPHLHWHRPIRTAPQQSIRIHNAYELGLHAVFQWELYKLAIPRSHKTDLTGNLVGNFLYKRWHT